MHETAVVCMHGRLSSHMCAVVQKFHSSLYAAEVRLYVPLYIAVVHHGAALYTAEEGS